MNGDLEPFVATGNCIPIPPRRVLADHDGEALGRKQVCWRRGTKPVLHLALDPQRHPQIAHEVRSPSPGGDDESLPCVGLVRGSHAKEPVAVVPPSDALARNNPRPVISSELEVGTNGNLGPQRSGAGFHHTHHIRHGPEPRHSPRNRGRVHHLMLQPMRLRASQRPTHKPPRRWPKHEPPRPFEYPPPAKSFDLLPLLKRPRHERHVPWILEIRLPNDPRLPMGRPICMRRLPPIDAEHPFPSPGEFKRNGAAHCTEPDDYHVIARAIPLAHISGPRVVLGCSLAGKAPGC